MTAQPEQGAPRKQGKRMSYRTKLIAGSVIAGIGVLSAGGVAFALWNAETHISGGAIGAGDFDLSYGEGSWSQITPDVNSPAGGTLSGGTAGFISMPGDMVELRIPVETTLRGENLNAGMNVDAGTGANHDLDRGVIAASYRVEDADQQAASDEAELGVPVTVTGLVGSNAGVTSSWTVVVTISVLGDYRWTDTEPMLDLDKWSVGGINVTLEQLRSGDGFIAERTAR